MKDVQNYEGLYAVTSCGRVWSYKTKKFLKPQKNKDGYSIVCLHKDGEQKNYYIHRLVAEAYLPNHNNLPCVNHKDENKENNALQNLEWCTYKYNNSYGSRNERAGKAISKALSKPVFCVELNKTFDGVRAAARVLGLGSGNITQCCKGTRKTCGGYHWRYQEVT